MGSSHSSPWQSIHSSPYHSPQPSPQTSPRDSPQLGRKKPFQDTTTELYDDNNEDVPVKPTVPTRTSPSVSQFQEPLQEVPTNPTHQVSRPICRSHDHQYP